MLRHAHRTFQVQGKGTRWELPHQEAIRTSLVPTMQSGEPLGMRFTMIHRHGHVASMSYESKNDLYSKK